MEIVLVGAPGSGTRTVGRALAEHRRARFVDLTGAPERHVDTFFTNRLVTARFLPFGPRLGPGSLHVRAGVGKATAQVQSTLGVDHFYTREDSGRGWLLGTGYAFRLGDKASIGLDFAWNRLDVASDAGPSARFLASTFTVQWHP